MSRLASIALLVALGCGPRAQAPSASGATTSPAEPPATPTSAADVLVAGDIVVVRSDVSLRRWPGEFSFELRVEDTSSITRPQITFTRWVVVADRGRWVEIAAMPATVRSCIRESKVLSRFGLHVAVEKKDLSLVTTEPLAIEYSNNTLMRVPIGVPVEPSDGGTNTFHGRRGPFTVPMATPNVGRSFAATVDVDDHWTFDASGAPALSLASDAYLYVGNGTKLTIDDDSWPVRRATYDGVDYAEHRSACLVLRARIKGSFSEDQALFGGLVGTAGPVVLIPRRTKVYWPDESEAGTMTRALETPRRHMTLANDGRLLCTTVQPAADYPVTLCFRTDTVSNWVPPRTNTVAPTPVP